MTPSPRPEPREADAVSKRIVEELQQDGRRSYAAIAKRVGLSEAAVRQRVGRLIEHGALQIVGVADPRTLGFHRQAMIGVRAAGELRPLAAALAELDEIDYVVITAGSFDILAELICVDDDHLLRLLDEQVRVLPGVREVEVFVYLELAKETYAWGPR